jgi:hypothetical protein
LASPAIATKCKQDSLGADEVQVEFGGRLSLVTKKGKPIRLKENNAMPTGSSFMPQPRSQTESVRSLSLMASGRRRQAVPSWT